MKNAISRIFFNKWAAFAHDVLCVPVALLLAYWLRFNMLGIPLPYIDSARMLLTTVMPLQSALFWFFGFYRGFWRFASLPDLIRIIQSVVVGTVLCVLVLIVLLRVGPVPRSVLVLYPLLLIFILSGSRLLYRYSKDHHFLLEKKSGKRALIVGAGRAGDSLVRDILLSNSYQPLGFLDDDILKHGREIRGVRVLGSLTDLATIGQQLSIETVLLAIPSARRESILSMVKECSRLELECKTLPSIFELTGQQIETRHLRNITVNDFLGRLPVKLDIGAIDGYLAGKIVLITGGGGSIGSELCRQVAKAQPKRLIVFEHGEFNLYSIELELRKKFPDLDLVVVLGDVKTENRVAWAFRKFRPEVVFHAAAYKHVPMLETNPAEGVFNNVIGTKMVADAADRFGVKRFVLVSTDKAVNPANVMGTTKRIAELYCQNLAQRSKTKFITTRFGNVLGSAGSVVPLFERQIKEGGPVTVTHKDISRYFMTIPEAVGLILQAGSMGRGGEIYVLEMGDPVLIRELAEQMILLSGLKLGEDIKIQYTGLRPGEKLFEEVFHAKEGLLGTEHPKLQLAQARLVDWQWLTEEIAMLKEAAQGRDLGRLFTQMKKIVPEYSGPGASLAEYSDEMPEPRLRVVA
ncbi:MAG: nucleoside-diphosphate sugar epimerase/dehydratase [Desulfobulbaceae bacterium]|nr:nucleoside-diphosphate sugar epimerase/dehydratase [Desulfobulbaceae bacterium]